MELTLYQVADQIMKLFAIAPLIGNYSYSLLIQVIGSLSNMVQTKL